MKRTLKYCAWVAAAAVTTALMVASCSTQSAKWTNVQYHNTTTHFNVWWNGNESLKEGVEKLESKVKDDYTQILPVYKLGTKEEAMAVKPQMDRAIEKGIKGIKKHSIFVKGEEHVKYIKNCYMLTAYASFYLQDYVTAGNTSRMVATQYSGTKEADEASILAARCLSMDKQYVEAETELDALMSAAEKGNVSSKVKADMYMAMAECLLPQEKYKKAVQYLKLAADEVKASKTEARLYFILGQIYQLSEKRSTATKYYQKVLKCNPDYVMEFNAKISIASCANFENTDLKRTERTLDRMLNDKKNEEFKDQIYYAKGEMYMGMKDAKKACDNYRLSVAAATANPAQKAKSSIRVADILYDLYENYDMAENYYDTAMHIIKPDYPHYSEIKSRYEVLASLVEYTRVISRNDSLLAVADMEPAEQRAMIEKKIEDLKKAEKEAKERELIEQFAADAKSQQNTLQGDWYFYNHNTVAKGKETFKQRYGMRPLEDYWFLSKKGMLGMGLIAGMEPPEAEADTTTTDSLQDGTAKMNSKDDPTDPHNVAYYLKDLPKTQGQRDTMDRDIALCLLNAGYIYYDGLLNTPRALECYLRMANNYTDHDEVVQAFYQLYRIYDKQGNTPSANYYRDMVLMGFPDCDYANLIRDSEYYKEIIKREQRIEDDYTDIYTQFRRRRYADVIRSAREAQSEYTGNPLLGRFHYWEGMSYARMEHKDSAIAVFERIVNSYAKTDTIAMLAQEQLTYLRGGKEVADGGEELTAKDEMILKQKKSDKTLLEGITKEERTLSGDALLYRYREKMQHYVIILINDKKIRATELQYKISDFNSEYYANSGYKVNCLMFTDSTQMITVHRFVNAEEAMNYWTHLQREESPLKKYNKSDYVIYPMSTQNYTTFYNKKKIDAYNEFFEYYYKQK